MYITYITYLIYFYLLWLKKIDLFTKETRLWLDNISQVLKLCDNNPLIKSSFSLFNYMCQMSISEEKENNIKI